MTDIYVISVNKEILYVGSSRNLEKRKRQHLRDDAWLAKFDESFVKFDVIEICEESERFEREGFHYDRLLIEGHKLFNKRDPRITGIPMTSEMAKIAMTTKRRNGTVGNAAKSAKGKKRPSISKALKGRVFSNEAKAKMSLAKIGKPNGRSGISRPNIATSQKERWREIHEIMIEMSVSKQEAMRIRKVRKNE